MNQFDPSELKKLFKPASDSHKNQNGKVMIIAGSRLFHAASLWPLAVASRIVDMVFYASVPENNDLVKNAKQEFRNGIVISRDQIDNYITEAGAILIGPGLPRPEGMQEGDDDTKALTEDLLKKYPEKKWVIDGGSLQTMNPEMLNNFKTMPILTPHHGEFETLFNFQLPIFNFHSNENELYEQIQNSVEAMAKKYHCVILLKGEKDIVSSPEKSLLIAGGNAGMTKGGTGDVLAGLVAALYAQNDDPFLVATCASYINKKAGESLFEKVGYYFNASDLADEVPKVMREVLV